jgi:lipopolysaccharide transport system permease protein
MFFAFGLGTWLSALNVKYRDFRYALPFFLQALFFATQIIYTVSIVENDWVRNLLALNPMNAVIELFRLPLTNKAANPQVLLIGCMSGSILTVFGLFYFFKTESYFADIA